MSKSEYHKVRLGMDMIPLYNFCNGFKNAQITMLEQSVKPFGTTLKIRIRAFNNTTVEMVFRGVRDFCLHRMPIESLDFKFYRFKHCFRFRHASSSSRITAKMLEWRCIEEPSE